MTYVPPVPDSLAATGLGAGFVGDLLLKVLHLRGASTGAELAAAVRLPFVIIDDVFLDLVRRRLVEVRSGAAISRAAYVFDITAAGEERAQLELAASRYAGPAPVTLEHYARVVAGQSVHQLQLERDHIRDGFRGMVLDDAFLDRIGPAISAARSLFLYGDAGNGKTMIAETIAAMLGEPIFVPFAVQVDGQVMMVYDPAAHGPPDVTSPHSEPDSIWADEGHDARFVRVRRPVVATGGELTLDELEASYDPVSRIYQAPVQVKANGGVLILDDFGRQRAPSRALLNRWMVPLEQRRELLALHTGTRFSVPFDCLLIFATNLRPEDLVEEAFLRRIRYKIFVPGPTPAQYAEIMRRACDEHGITFDPDAVRYIYSRFYDRLGLEPRACHPRDIVSHVTDVCGYLGRERALTPDILDRACESCFLARPATASNPLASPLPA